MGRPRLETSYPPRGMRSDQAATYLGMSESSFLRLVEEGIFPQGVLIKGMRIWDRHDLDRTFENLKALPEIKRNTVAQALGVDDG